MNDYGRKNDVTGRKSNDSCATPYLEEYMSPASTIISCRSKLTSNIQDLKLVKLAGVATLPLSLPAGYHPQVLSPDILTTTL